MANNCLVTKLKSVVDNDNLEKLGCIRVSINPASGNNLIFFGISEGKEIKVTILDDNTITSVNSGNEKISDKVAIIRYSAGNPYPGFYTANNTTTLIEIEGKYNLTTLDSVNELPIDSLFSLPDFIGLSGNVKGDIEEFSKISTLSRLTLTYNGQNYMNLYGDVIKAFGGNANIVSLKMNMCAHVNAWSLEKLIKEQRFTANRSNGTIAFVANQSNVTFNGITITEYSTKDITWEPNSSVSTNTDITYNNVTVTIDQNGDIVS